MERTSVRVFNRRNALIQARFRQFLLEMLTIFEYQLKLLPFITINGIGIGTATKTKTNHKHKLSRSSDFSLPTNESKNGVEMPLHNLMIHCKHATCYYCSVSKVEVVAPKVGARIGSPKLLAPTCTTFDGSRKKYIISELYQGSTQLSFLLFQMLLTYDGFLTILVRLPKIPTPHHHP